MSGPGTMEDILRPTSDPTWVLAADGYDPLREASVEARFSISNGFLGVRGARSTTRGSHSAAPTRTYVAGLFDTTDAKGAPPGLVPAADWVPTRILLPAGPLVYHPGEVSSRRIILDIKRGALLTAGHFTESPDLGLQVHTLRLVSLADRGLGLQLIQLEIEHGVVDVTFEASFEGINRGLVSETIGPDLGAWHTR